MGSFNYSKLRIFNSQGIELPVSIKSDYKITIPSEHGAAAVFYPVTDSSGNIIDYYKESSGTRFTGNSPVIKCIVGNEFESNASVEYSEYSVINDDLSTETPKKEYSIKSVKTVDFPDGTAWPSIKLNTFINFKPVSTELIETETLYIFVKDEQSGEYKKISDYDSDFGNRYELLFFIDCRSQEDFRFFRVENDDVIWSDRIFINFNSDDENSYRVNIGFTSKEEGNFTETLHICLIDRGENLSVPRENSEIITIGEIELSGETIGEDERYRTLFTNFGIPDPKEYPTLFTNTPLDDDNIDNILLNQNSKKMFLAYPEIFPYVGTYKALANAVKTLGYEDLYFKEWYKRTGSIYGTGYVSYDMSYNADTNANVINNTSLEERIHLKKLNWLSMVYRINKEIADLPEDKYGFPQVENIYDFSHEDILVKLIALRDWLQKYIIGLNCRIIDVGGEGIYFERYANGTYGTYETVYDWTNCQELSPSIVHTIDNVLVDSSANILINLNLDDSEKRIEEISDYRFSDFIEGAFIDETFKKDITDLDETGQGVVYCGKTLYSFSELDRYQVRASISCQDFVFGHYTDGESYLTDESSSLWLHNDELYLDPLDLHNGKNPTAKFENAPLIYVRKGAIHSYKHEYADNNARLRSVQDDWLDPANTLNIIETDEKLLYPEADAEFFYGEEKDHGRPVFIMKNYNISELGAVSDEEYNIVEIKDGQILFSQSGNTDKSVMLNFKEDSDGNQKITVNIVYTSPEVNPRLYLNGKDPSDMHHYFAEGNYPVFYTAYMSDPATATKYDEIISLNVNHAGTYHVDVFGKDLRNNIFAAKIKDHITIQAQKYDIVSYSTVDNDNPILTQEKNFIINNYINYCIYKKEYNSFFIKESDENGEDTSLKIKYTPYSNSIVVPKNGSYIHFSNKMEKFELDPEVENPIISEGPSTSESYEKDGKKIYVNEGYRLYVRKANRDSFYSYYDVPAVNSARDINKMFENTEYDVNVILYNELGGYPVYQTYGRMTPNGDGYVLEMSDSSDQDYIWAKGGDTQGEYMPENWITKPDPASPAGDTFYYGVGYRSGIDGKLYYIKTKEMTPGEIVDNDSTAQTGNSLNFSFDLIELLSHKGIGIYIEPTNLVGVTISNIDPDSLNSNRIIIQIASERSINVSVGDMVKLIFTSAIDNNRFMTAAYKVVEKGSDTLVAEGRINNAYVRILGNAVFYNTGRIFESANPESSIWRNNINDFIDSINNENIERISLVSDNMPTAIYDKDDNAITLPGFEIETEVRVPDENDPEKSQIRIKRTRFVVMETITEAGTAHYNVFERISTQNFVPRQKRNDQVQNLNTFMTYSHTAYTDYVLETDSAGVKSKGDISLSFKGTNHNRWIMDYIDSKFVVTTREFDTNNGIYSWMDLTDPRDAHDNVFGGVPAISEKQIFKYSNPLDHPAMERNNSMIVITPKDNILSNNKIYWKIWRLSNISNERIFEFESYNPVLYLNVNTPGIYDIEMNVYDKFGNVSTNTIKGAFKVI